MSNRTSKIIQILYSTEDIAKTKKIINKRINRFSLSKQSFLKKSNIASTINSLNEGYSSYINKRGGSHTYNDSLKPVSLSIDRKKIKIGRIISMNKSTSIKKKSKTTMNKFKILNKKKLLKNPNNFSFKSFDFKLQNYISLNNTTKSFFRNLSKPMSIKKVKVKENDKYKTLTNSSKKSFIFHNIYKNKLKTNEVKNKTINSNKKYIFVQKNKLNNQNNQINNLYLNSKKLNFNTINSVLLNPRFKRIVFNKKISHNYRLKSYNNSNKKNFTFKEIKIHNKLLKIQKSNDIILRKELPDKFSFKENALVNEQNKKYDNSNKLKDIILSKNYISNSIKYRNNLIKKNKSYQKNKTEDNINYHLIESQKHDNTKKNNSVKRRNNSNIDDIINKILKNKNNKGKSQDTNNSLQKKISNFILSKRESFNINKNKKKLNKFCNLLIIDNNRKKELYTNDDKSFKDKSKLIDYINFKVINNKKEKDLKNINNINIKKNKIKKKEKISRNYNNSSNFTNSNIENHNTNYISPKQFEKEEEIGNIVNTPFIYNKMLSKFMNNMNESLRMTINNSNRNIINNNKKLLNNKEKNRVINKIIHKKKIIHDKNSSLSNNCTTTNSLKKEKKNYFNIPQKLSLTPIKKGNRFEKNTKLKNDHHIPIIKKVIKIDSCTVSGYSSPNVAKINQDNYFIIKEFMNDKEQFFMGICDGHGSYGHLISKYICNNLPKKIIQISEDNISEAFLSINNSLIKESKIDCTLSGSTCCSLIISQDKIISANVGDSRAVISRYEKGQFNAINLTRDHKPTESDEMKRIINSGGRIKPFVDNKSGKCMGPDRIWLKNSEIPGLAMSRSLGDNLAHTVGVISQPEIQNFEFNGNEKFIILASDGIWEFIDSDESVKIIKDFYENGKDAVGALNKLVKEAFNRWKKEEDNIDDITAILVFLD